MKKIGIFGVCALLSLGAMAQESVVKEAKKAKTFEEMVKIITPAFSDPATANNPETYFIPGKAGVEVYTKAAFKARTEGDGQMSEAEGLKASQALLQGYDYLMKAYELDPKAAKPNKYTKDIAKLLLEAYDGFNLAGMYFYNANDFMKAYKAWDIYVTLPDSPLFAGNKLMQAKTVGLTDQLKADLIFNMGICAYKAEDLKIAYDAFKRSIQYAPDNKNAYDLALNCAAMLKDKALTQEIAQLGFERFGAEDVQFLSFLVQGLLDDSKYQDAIALVDNAIAANPGVSHYYYMKGFILAQDDVKGDAEPLFRKAIEIDDENDNAYFWLAYTLLKKYDEINDNAPVDPAAYHKVKEEQLNPILREAIPYLEKAYQIKNSKDMDTSETETVLRNAYYNLGLDPDVEMQKLQ